MLDNVKRKEVDAQNMFHEMVGYMKKKTIHQLSNFEIKTAPYNPKIEMELPQWLKF